MQEKTLQDLTKEEIGRLFPIEICSYSKNWPDLFKNEKNLIAETLEPSLFSRIEYFGSTAVPGLSAKDTIDILMEVEFEDSKNQRLIDLMKSLSYAFNWQNEDGILTWYLLKGTTYQVLKIKPIIYMQHLKIILYGIGFFLKII